MADMVVTAGATTANSYSSIDDADIYHEKHLYASNWTSANDESKEKALMWATRLLDEMVIWQGLAKTSTQALLWPRQVVYDREGNSISSTEIPQFLKDATAEFARLLISEDRTLETNRDLVGFKKMKVDVLELEVDTYKNKPVMPPSVWSIVKFYGRKTGRTKILVRI